MSISDLCFPLPPTALPLTLPQPCPLPSVLEGRSRNTGGTRSTCSGGCVLPVPQFGAEAGDTSICWLSLLPPHFVWLSMLTTQHLLALSSPGALRSQSLRDLISLSPAGRAVDLSLVLSQTSFVLLG